MTIHEAFLELAATTIDFDLDPIDRAELDWHIAGCEECRRTGAAFRDDAAAIAQGLRPHLSAARSEAILASVLRPPKNSPPLRLIAVVALVAVIGAGLVAAGMEYLRRSQSPLLAVQPSPSASSSQGPSNGPTTGPSARPGQTAQPATGTPRPVASPAVGTLPVRGFAQLLGTKIRIAPGPDGNLYVSIPTHDDSVVLALLGEAGRPMAGWPIELADIESCDLLYPVEDGSVRALCTLGPEGSPSGVMRALAFDSKGTLLAGWPIDLDLYGADGYFAGRVIGDELTLYSWASLGDQIQAGQPAGNAWIMRVAADGTVRSGAQVQYGIGCCHADTWAVGPDGVAYGIVHDLAAPSTEMTSELSAVGPEGVPAGFPVAIDGIASEPAFDAAARIHVTVGSPVAPPARILAFGADGRASDYGSEQVAIAATSDWTGAGGDFPAAPLVGDDGTTFVIDTTDGATVVGLSPAGQVMTGWPYRSAVGLEYTGFCGSGDTGCGQFRAASTVGPENVLYLLHAAASSSAGGSIVAIGQDGRVVAGWPVSLTRQGSEFWSVVVAPDGTAYALAIEPEPNNSHSATILAIAPDSTVLYTATVVEP